MKLSALYNGYCPEILFLWQIIINLGGGGGFSKIDTFILFDYSFSCRFLHQIIHYLKGVLKCRKMAATL